MQIFKRKDPADEKRVEEAKRRLLKRLRGGSHGVTIIDTSSKGGQK